MSLFGKCPKSLFIFLFPFFLVACKSNSNDLPSEKSEGRRNELNQVLIPDQLPSYAQIRIAKIIQDSEANRITDSEADESFLLGKLLEEKRDFENAEKLFTVSFNNTKSIASGLSLTNTLVNLKKLDKALTVALKLSVLYPQRPEIEMILATIYQMQGDNESVIRTLERAYKKHPNNESIVIFYVSNVKKNSKKILENFLAKNPRSTIVMLALSQRYFQDKNNISALKYAKSAYLLDPDNIDIMTMIGKIEQHDKNYPEAEKYFRMAFEKEIDNNLNAQNYINILLYQKKMQEALAILLKLETSSDDQVPFPPEFSFQIAKILLLNKDYEGAKKRLVELSNSKYNNPAIKYYLAICSEALRNFQDAITYLNEIPPESELFQESIKAKILIYINSNNKIEAEKSIDKFIISDQNIVEDSIFKSNILAYFSNYQVAIDILNNTIKKEPNARELYLKKAEYIKYTESVAASIQFAEQIITRWPNYADGLNFLGYSLLESNIRLEYAKKLLHKAVVISPQNGFYLDSLGWLYFQKNETKISTKYLLEALKYEPDEPVIIYHLAIVQLKEQLYEKSLKNLEITSKILTDMLPYQLESDPELEKISKSIGSKIIEVKKLIENQTQKKNMIGIL